MQTYLKDFKFLLIMGLFSKEKKGDDVNTDLTTLPELPAPQNLELPSLPSSLETPSQEVPGLPPIETNNISSLPDLKQPQSFDQKEIKEALDSPPSIPTSDFQKSEFNELKTVEAKLPEMEPQKSHMATIDKTPGIYSVSSKQETVEPVFIRLDKFQNAVETFEEIVDKVNDIENLIKKTKEIRLREEEELNAWEKEIHTIKTRMDSIDKSVFSKLDLI